MENRSRTTGRATFPERWCLTTVRLVRQAAYKIVNRGSIFGSLFTERGWDDFRNWLIPAA